MSRTRDSNIHRARRDGGLGQVLIVRATFHPLTAGIEQADVLGVQTRVLRTVVDHDPGTARVLHPRLPGERHVAQPAGGPVDDGADPVGVRLAVRDLLSGHPEHGVVGEEAAAEPVEPPLLLPVVASSSAVVMPGVPADVGVPRFALGVTKTP